MRRTSALLLILAASLILSAPAQRALAEPPAGKGEQADAPPPADDA